MYHRRLISAAPGLSAAHQQQYPHIAERLRRMTEPSVNHNKALCAGTRQEVGRALANILVNRYRCTVKGGIIRDAVALDVDTFKDIDVEMDPSVTENSVDRWLGDFVEYFESTFDATFAVYNGKKWRFRDSVDGIAQAHRH